jgi:hypothetical protein
VDNNGTLSRSGATHRSVFLAGKLRFMVVRPFHP